MWLVSPIGVRNCAGESIEFIPSFIGKIATNSFSESTEIRHVFTKPCGEMENGIMLGNYIFRSFAPSFNKCEEITFSGGNARFFFALSSQFVGDIGTKKAASHASEKEPNKLWCADPYGLIHDLADIIHYSLVILIAGIISFVALYRRQPLN